jgi:hypothetical protein
METEGRSPVKNFGDQEQWFKSHQILLLLNYPTISTQT